MRPLSLGLDDARGADKIIRSYSGKWYYADVKDCKIDPDMLARQGIVGNWWWHYRVPGRGELDWGKIVAALTDSGYDYVMSIENEDREVPGEKGFEIGCRHLRSILERIDDR